MGNLERVILKREHLKKDTSGKEHLKKDNYEKEKSEQRNNLKIRE